MLAVSCLTCSVSLARPADTDDDTAALRSFLSRHGDDECLAGLDLPAVRSQLV